MISDCKGNEYCQRGDNAVTRVIICGGRDFNNKELCFKMLGKYLSGIDNLEIISGHAKGADTLAEEYASAHNLAVCLFKPDWNKYGKSAG